MDDESLKETLKRVKKGEISIDEASVELRKISFSDIGFAKLDDHRALRTGQNEVIFCLGKTPEQVREIAKELGKNKKLLATKATPEQYASIKKEFEEAIYFENSKTVTLKPEENDFIGSILILTAGTSDHSIAEEALVTAQFLGSRTELIADVGVAGIHRLFSHKEDIDKAKVIIVIAGMEGALASVVAGIVSVPVIAVPTSIGYGASFEGLAALLSMMNSCAPGVAVVNIDNGFGAGYLAHIINNGLN